MGDISIMEYSALQVRLSSEKADKMTPFETKLINGLEQCPPSRFQNMT